MTIKQILKLTPDEIVDHLKAIPQRVATWYFKRRIRRGVQTLNRLDTWMTSAGYVRHERRQFWRDFISKQEVRDKTFDQLEKGSKV